MLFEKHFLQPSLNLHDYIPTNYLTNLVSHSHANIEVNQNSSRITKGLEQKIDDLNKVIEQLKAKNQNSHQHTFSEARSTELKNLETKIATYNTYVRDFIYKIENTDDIVQNCLDFLSHFVSMQDPKNKNNELLQKIKNLKNKPLGFKEQQQVLKATCNHMEKKLRTNLETISDLENTIKNLKTQNIVLETKSKNEIERSTILEERLKKNESKVNEYTKKIKDLNDIISKQNEDINQTKKMQDLLKDDTILLERYKAKVAQLENEKDNFMKTTTLSNVNFSLSSSHQNSLSLAEGEKITLEKTIVDLKKQIEVLEEKKQIQKKNPILSLSSFFSSKKKKDDDDNNPGSAAAKTFDNFAEIEILKFEKEGLVKKIREQNDLIAKITNNAENMNNNEQLTVIFNENKKRLELLENKNAELATKIVTMERTNRLMEVDNSELKKNIELLKNSSTFGISKVNDPHNNDHQSQLLRDFNLIGPIKSDTEKTQILNYFRDCVYELSKTYLSAPLSRSVLDDRYTDIQEVVSKWKEIKIKIENSLTTEQKDLNILKVELETTKALSERTLFSLQILQEENSKLKNVVEKKTTELAENQGFLDVIKTEYNAIISKVLKRSIEISNSNMKDNSVIKPISSEILSKFDEMQNRIVDLENNLNTREREHNIEINKRSQEFQDKLLEMQKQIVQDSIINKSNYLIAQEKNEITIELNQAKRSISELLGKVQEIEIISKEKNIIQFELESAKKEIEKLISQNINYKSDYVTLIARAGETEKALKDEVSNLRANIDMLNNRLASENNDNINAIQLLKNENSELQNTLSQVKLLNQRLASETEKIRKDNEDLYNKMQGFHKGELNGFYDYLTHLNYSETIQVFGSNKILRSIYSNLTKFQVIVQDIDSFMVREAKISAAYQFLIHSQDDHSFANIHLTKFEKIYINNRKILKIYREWNRIVDDVIPAGIPIRQQITLENFRNYLYMSQIQFYIDSNLLNIFKLHTFNRNREHVKKSITGLYENIHVFNSIQIKNKDHDVLITLSDAVETQIRKKNHKLFGKGASGKGKNPVGMEEEKDDVEDINIKDIQTIDAYIKGIRQQRENFKYKAAVELLQKGEELWKNFKQGEIASEVLKRNEASLHSEIVNNIEDINANLNNINIYKNIFEKTLGINNLELLQEENKVNFLFHAFNFEERDRVFKTNLKTNFKDLIPCYFLKISLEMESYYNKNNDFDKSRSEIQKDKLFHQTNMDNVSQLQKNYQQIKIKENLKSTYIVQNSNTFLLSVIFVQNIYDKVFALMLVELNNLLGNQKGNQSVDIVFDVFQLKLIEDNFQFLSATRDIKEITSYITTYFPAFTENVAQKSSVYGQNMNLQVQQESVERMKKKGLSFLDNVLKDDKSSGLALIVYILIVLKYHLDIISKASQNQIHFVLLNKVGEYYNKFINSKLDHTGEWLNSIIMIIHYYLPLSTMISLVEKDFVYFDTTPINVEKTQEQTQISLNTDFESFLGGKIEGDHFLFLAEKANFTTVPLTHLLINALLKDNSDFMELWNKKKKPNEVIKEKIAYTTDKQLLFKKFVLKKTKRSANIDKLCQINLSDQNTSINAELIKIVDEIRPEKMMNEKFDTFIIDNLTENNDVIEENSQPLKITQAITEKESQKMAAIDEATKTAFNKAENLENTDIDSKEFVKMIDDYTENKIDSEGLGLISIKEAKNIVVGDTDDNL